MSATQTDVRPHFAVVQALLNDHLSPASAYAPDEIPGGEQTDDEEERKKPLPSIFVQLGMEQRSVPPVGLVARSTRGGWRITTDCLGRTYLEASWAMARVNNALRNARYVVDGDVVKTFHESTTQPRWDTSRWHGVVIFTASH